jgi:hypothetical protein
MRGPVLLVLALTVTLVLGLAGSAAAQTELMQMLNPTLGQQMPRFDYRITYFPDEHVRRQDTDFSYIQHRPVLSVPLWQDAVDEWVVSAALRMQDFDTHAVFPDSGERFPGELWDAAVAITYRHKFENNWIGSINLSVGSASDKPFNSWDEMYIRATALLRVPQGENNAWLFSILYANDERFLFGLSGIPIPGIAYQWVPSKYFQAIIGIPFTSVQFRPVEQLTFDAQYIPVRRVRARTTYVVFAPLRLWLQFDWDSEHYALADRDDKNDRLFYYEKRVTAGIRFDLRHVGVEIAGGRIFDRLYFTGETYSDHNENRIDVDNGWFGAAQLSLRF